MLLSVIKITAFIRSLYIIFVSFQGVMEAIRISCAGYPTRRTFYEFVDRFGILAPEVLDGSCDEVTASKRLLGKVDLNGYQVNIIN
ncbi:hypothetical protein HHK36_020413 [Tetracentron sinense]|uniref:Myosin motor domain-containing protein n=1 Tax=Tetracentron sinense TaxID=13715 RepID=A0A834YYY8_TETSI|nr:hypothetical protein HHK36_020413 [Tetracentron sinense]